MNMTSYVASRLKEEEETIEYFNIDSSDKPYNLHYKIQEIENWYYVPSPQAKYLTSLGAPVVCVDGEYFWGSVKFSFKD